VPGVVVAAPESGPPAPPEPQPARRASVTASKRDAENLEISWLEKFWLMQFFT
jgi:hypothetical protein